MSTALTVLAYIMLPGAILTAILLGATTRIRNRREEDELAQFTHRWVERS